ncbi:hypothetical protein [Ralstonia solanacearum]|uniref:hypothetical protein n=1 Tax=Ralstonia solanacearum TaxID=305 RepID=UPI001E4CFBF0|nr:hypothetical protein [Ralstonia solanacearum]
MTRAKQNPGKRWVNVRLAGGVALDVVLPQHAVTKNGPHRRRAENQLKKALSLGQVQCMESVAAAALGYALIARAHPQ